MEKPSVFYRVVTVALRAALLGTLLGAGWLIYKQLPPEPGPSLPEATNQTTLQLVLRQSPDMGGAMLDIPIEIYPVDIVAIRHEYFTERRAGKRFDDFLSERMKGRTPINARLDRQGQTSVVINPGTWWVHAVLSGEEDLEWRLPINVYGPKQVIELTSQNAYGRTKSF
ncbi:MAG: hypothetical protein ACR2H6_15200 [Pyrinomonadaceae bacterium]